MSTPTSYGTVRYEVRDNILTLTLNRPDRLNAFTTQMMSDLIKSFDKADADDNVRAIVITGEGRGFCAGADLEAGANTFNYAARDKEKKRHVPEVNGTPDLSHENARDGGGRVSLRIFSCLKPVIAAINGPAVGVGVTMTLPMDIRLASSDARFGFVFTRRGIVPEACSSWFLPRIVGISKALEWTMTGRVFDAAQALEGGLVSAVHAPEDLLPAAYSLAEEIRDNTAPVSVALSRQMLWRTLGADDPMEGHKIESRGIQTRGKSEDAKEGIKAFLEKRAANFPCTPSQDMPDYFPWWQERPYK